MAKMKTLFQKEFLRYGTKPYLLLRQIWQALLHEAKERELGMVIVSHSESLLKRICTRRIDLKALQEKMAAV